MRCGGRREKVMYFEPEENRKLRILVIAPTRVQALAFIKENIVFTESNQIYFGSYDGRPALYGVNYEYYAVGANYKTKGQRADQLILVNIKKEDDFIKTVARPMIVSCLPEEYSDLLIQEVEYDYEN